jgi:hypothetical protein
LNDLILFIAALRQADAGTVGARRWDTGIMRVRIRDLTGNIRPYSIAKVRGQKQVALGTASEADDGAYGQYKFDT